MKSNRCYISEVYQRAEHLKNEQTKPVKTGIIYNFQNQKIGAAISAAAVLCACLILMFTNVNKSTIDFNGVVADYTVLNGEVTLVLSENAAVATAARSSEPPVFYTVIITEQQAEELGIDMGTELSAKLVLDKDGNIVDIKNTQIIAKE